MEGLSIQKEVKPMSNRTGFENEFELLNAVLDSLKYLYMFYFPSLVLNELYDDLLSTCEIIGLAFKKLDLLEFSHHRNHAVDIMKSNINWKDVSNI